MRNYFLKITNILPIPMANQWLKLLIIISAISSIASWYISYKLGYATAYNDSMSHLNIARLVIDNAQPGLSQLGSVWLPFNHLLFLLLIWNDWAWHSGFAGSMFSMIAYILSVTGIYRIVTILTNNHAAAFVGGLTFALNLNILYLQSTPLTEPLLLLFIIYSILSFIRYIQTNDTRYLIALGVLGAMGVMTRYDAWFLVFIEAELLLYHQWKVAKSPLPQVFGKLLLFGFPAIFAIVLWLAWNMLIFGDPLYFALGPYSAKSQQDAIAAHHSLITKGNLLVSIKAYWFAIVANVGSPILLLSCLGFLVYLFKKVSNLNYLEKGVAAILGLAPIAFNILALYAGFSILNLPALNWNPSADESGQWFNVRYGIMALPIAAIAIGFFANFRRALAILTVITVIFQGILSYREGIITLIDGTKGSSSFANGDIAEVLRQTVGDSDRLLISTSFFNAVTFQSGTHLKNIIHEGLSKEWGKTLETPEYYADWIVMANGDVGEPVYTRLVKIDENAFKEHYKPFFVGQHAVIYKKRAPSEQLVVKREDMLFIGHTEFTPAIKHIPDLAYRTQEDILILIAQAKNEGFNTIEFNAYGDGIAQGFQPSAGILNEGRLVNLDLIIQIAQEQEMRLLPVLTGDDPSLGGESQYLRWIGQNRAPTQDFYANPNAISLFENYLNHIATRNNTLTNEKYSDSPAILAWKITSNSVIPDAMYSLWSDRIAGKLISHDPNHLIALPKPTQASPNSKITILE